jgi:4-amino-4-deoxy-L-arabinose transferase-like glycosyltransferase
VVLACGAPVLAAVLWLPPLLPVDETRYATVAYEMWQRHELWLPLLNGEPYSHKPPLLFWILQLGWWLFGTDGALWPRAVSGGLSLACCLLTADIARRLWPQRSMIALMAPAILIGSLAWALWTPAVMFDVLLSSCVLLAIDGLLMLSQGRSLGYAAWLAGLALGTLAKGPVVLLYCGGAALFAPLWWPQSPMSRRRYLAVGVLAAIGVLAGMSWLLGAMMEAGPGYLGQVLWNQGAGRTIDSFAHRRPFWWYLPLVPLMLFPWALWPRAWRALTASAIREDRGMRMLASWLAPTFLALCVISGKQVQYLIPLMPAFALWLARTLDAAAPGPRAGDGWAIAGALLLCAMVALLAPHWPLAAAASSMIENIPRWLPLLLAGLALASLQTVRAAIGDVHRLATIGVATVTVLLVGFAEMAGARYDLRPMAAAVAAVQANGRLVGWQGVYHGELQFLGRLQHPLATIEARQLRSWACAHPDAAVVVQQHARPRRPPDLRLAGAPAQFEQPYRAGTLRLMDASVIAALDGCTADPTAAASD